MKIFHKWIIVLFLALLIFSCKKGSNGTDPATQDTTKPVINLTDPINSKTVILGSVLHLQMDLSDNIELKSYKVVIIKSLKGLATSDWTFSQTWPITAGKKTYIVNQNEIIIPLTVTGNQTTSGNYDLAISCLDTSGNESLISINIIINK
jgi:hypothetical protein